MSDCDNPACQILKPHEHIPGGVYFQHQRVIKRLEVENATLREALENKHAGSSFISFLKQELIDEAVEAMSAALAKELNRGIEKMVKTDKRVVVKVPRKPFVDLLKRYEKIHSK